MPPPQRLLSPNTERVSRRCAERPWGLRFSGTLFLHVVILALLLLPLSAPSKTAAAPGESSPPWANSSSWSHWAIPDDEVCPSARAWVTRPGSFCTTLWTSPYLSNRTELESRERRAVQIYCELDVILERFDCGQEYSVNVKRGQCQLCRQAYREWVCAVVADTTADGSLDCATKLMPCPSCASICHQVMRLCPYLSPDRIQFDLLGQPSPQVSQYGGHPAFYCPLENDDPSDPAYTTSLCLAPQEDDDPDHVHNICTNPPLGLSLGGRIHTHQFHHLHHHHHHRRTRRDQTYDDDTDYTTPRPNHHPPPYDYGGGGGGGYDSYDDDTATSSSPIPMHYTTCCWTYASSLVIFDATKDYPNYGSDAFFSTTLTIFDNATTRNSSNLSSTTTTTTTPSSPLFPTKKTATTSRRPTTGPPPTTTSLPTTKYANSSSAEGADDPTENRVILNCCNSHGECSAVDGDEEEEDGGGEDLSSSSPPSPPDDDVFPPRPPIQEIKSDPQLVKFSVKNRKRSSERREISENDNQEDVGSGLLLEGDLSPSSSSSSSSSSPPASSSVLSLPPLFFKTIDLPPNPTHISQVEEDVEYDEHYMDTEPDQQQGEGSTSTERLLEHVVLDDELEEDDDLEEDIDDEEEVSEVEDLLRQVKKKVVIKATTGRPGILLGGNKKVIKNRASVQLFPSSKKDAFMSIVIGHRGGGGGDEHVLDRADHHPQTAAALLLKKRIIPTRHFLHGEIPLKTRHNDDESFTFADNTISSSRQQDNHVAERVTRQERSSSSPPAKRPPTLLELFTYFTFLSSSSLVTPISLLIFVFTVATSVVAVAHVTLMLANLVAATSPCSTTTSLCWGTSFLVLLISAVVLWISTRFHFLSDWWGGSTLSWWWSGGGVKLKKYCVHRLLFYGEGGGGGGCWIPEKVASFLLLLFFSGRNQKLSPPTTKTRLDSSADIAKKLGNNYDSNSASVQSSLQLSSSSRRRDYYCLLFTNRQDKDTNRDVKKYCTSKKISRLAMEKYQCCYYCHHRHEWGCDPVGDGRRRGKENDDNNSRVERKLVGFSPPPPRVHPARGRRRGSNSEELLVDRVALLFSLFLKKFTDKVWTRGGGKEQEQHPTYNYYYS
ncbi:hypothetical protein Fcan01_27561 [Folsomia candida]|uniref:Uncharacterized protein n=1 Tax=Folsomia candida TaxID=158441 RepID=A0A226D059_FOLCA|nr:hypothetical protein Fcan01_27561 [Folsomia candida]